MPVFGFTTNNELAALLQQVLANQAAQSKREKQIMTGQDDLKAQLATLATNVSDNTAEIEAGIAKLIAANQSGDDAAFEAAAQAVQTANASLRSETDKLHAALNPPPPPGP